MIALYIALNLVLLDSKGSTVNYSRIFKENFNSKRFSFAGYMEYFIKTHLCLKTTINGHKECVCCSESLMSKILRFYNNLKSITRFKILQFFINTL